MPTRLRTRVIDAALGAAVGAAAAASLFRLAAWRSKRVFMHGAEENIALDPSQQSADAQVDSPLHAPVPMEPPVPMAPVRRAARTVKLRTLAILAALGAAGAAAFVYFGVYNVAATEEHTAPVYYLLHYAMKRSVSVRADRVKVPDLSDPEHARKGFVLYREHCLQCHGAPGIAPEPAALGLRPEPLDLAGRAGREWRLAEIYRVVKHGIKPTGMPAWEFRLSEAEIWDLTAFIKVLPTISPKEYKDWDRTERPAGTVAVTVSDSAGPGDPKAGKYAMQQYLCSSCHSIPGVTGADKTVGPPLGGIAGRMYIGGMLANTPANMLRWLRNPQEVDPLSAMPDLRIKEKDLRDMVAFLSTLDDRRGQ
jgi:mono/diheme cytochrome c family protein